MSHIYVAEGTSNLVEEQECPRIAALETISDKYYHRATKDRQTGRENSLIVLFWVLKAYTVDK